MVHEKTDENKIYFNIFTFHILTHYTIFIHLYDNI